MRFNTSLFVRTFAFVFFWSLVCQLAISVVYCGLIAFLAWTMEPFAWEWVSLRAAVFVSFLLSAFYAAVYEERKEQTLPPPPPPLGGSAIKKGN